MIKRGADEWPMIEGDEGFGELGGQRTETFPEACTQNKSLVHGADLRSHWGGRNEKLDKSRSAGSRFALQPLDFQ